MYVRKDRIMKKRLFSLVMICCLLMAMIPVSVSAAQKETISPLWDNTNSVTASLDFNGTTGNVYISIMGQSGVSNITADVKLYYKNTFGTWTEIVKGWAYDVDQMYLVVSESFTGVPSREYKIEVSATVTKGGYGESISKTATEVCPITP